MSKSTLYNMYSDLVNAVKPIVSSKYVFLKDRPKFENGELPMKRFIVIDLPVTIDDYVIGNNRTYLTTKGVFYLFVQGRSNETLDLNAMGELVDAVTSLFPIRGDYVVASNAEVRMSGSDGLGFQVTTVSFDVHSR